jgi:hypothetical protein
VKKSFQERLNPLANGNVLSVLVLCVSIDQLWYSARCLTFRDTDPKTGSRKCCDLGEKFITDPTYTSEGKCCESDTFFSFDPQVGKGDCCPQGQKFIEGGCRSPPPPPPQRPPPSDCNCHGNTPPTSGCSDKDCPQDFVCACDDHLGIKYGHCYTMTDVNGLPLNRDVGGTYQSGGDIGNLIFRVRN